MAEHESPLPAGRITEEAFMADRMKFWGSWNNFALYSSIAIALFTIYLCFGLSDGFTGGKTLALLIAELAVLVRAQV